MAAFAAGGHRERQSRRAGKEIVAGEAPRGAEIPIARRQTTNSRARSPHPAYAKINLRLDILGKRADGYHELRTIFQTVSLHDDLRLRASKRQPGISLSVHGNEALAHEPVKKNLVYRAVDELRRELKIRGGVEIVLHKTIPAGGGLGGGSSDAAAALLGYLQIDRT